ncbi:hypothetical protein [Bradyrhizobium erythrophlei]|uniref:Secreted protein n=1 Tax=Bradyrhizobium erythrophlei TaxID=1437360 RepID=A0A1M5NE11_9BRAD|nr:hypothetical protein [Bradyrhizobium erythrophlei]SHG87695.1 hypothetical protein SAMN05443248_2954 [Bradyrhizobium erythrophlei]
MMTLIRFVPLLFVLAVAPISSAQARGHHHYRHHHRALRRRAVTEGAVVVGTRPTGCPHAFCGCEASLFLFHKIVPALNLAYNWLRKFPRAEPAPYRAAARSGHVFVLLRHVVGDLWFVHDGNSGHHLIREHVRSIRGFVIVDPSGNPS